MLNRILLMLVTSVCFASNTAAQKFNVGELLQLFNAESNDLMVTMGRSKGISIKFKTDSTFVIQTQETQRDSTFEVVSFQKNQQMLQAYCYQTNAFNNWIEEIERLKFDNLGHSDDDLFNIFYVKGNVLIILSAEKKTQTGITLLTIMPLDH